MKLLKYQDNGKLKIISKKKEINNRIKSFINKKIVKKDKDGNSIYGVRWENHEGEKFNEYYDSKEERDEVVKDFIEETKYNV